MKYEGEITVANTDRTTKLLDLYRELLTKTDKLFNCGNNKWSCYNNKAKKVEVKILKILNYDPEKFFVAFPYISTVVTIRPKQVG